MHVLVHTQPGGVRGGGAALLMHEVASLLQALPALPPAMYFVFSRVGRRQKIAQPTVRLPCQAALRQVFLQEVYSITWVLYTVNSDQDMTARPNVLYSSTA